MQISNLELPPYQPYFDSLDRFDQSNSFINLRVTELSSRNIPDAGYVYELCIAYLDELKQSPNNFKAARSEITTFLIWCWDVEGILLSEVTRRDMNRFLEWCSKPCLTAIGETQRPQFLLDKTSGERVPNPLWRPFVKRTPKGSLSGIDSLYTRKASATKQQLSVLSSFYQFLNDEEYCDRNPAALVMRRTRFKDNLSPIDWQYDSSTIKALNPLQTADSGEVDHPFWRKVITCAS